MDVLRHWCFRQVVTHVQSPYQVVGDERRFRELVERVLWESKPKLGAVESLDMALESVRSPYQGLVVVGEEEFGRAEQIRQVPESDFDVGETLDVVVQHVGSWWKRCDGSEQRK